jgi:hypothetical protein
MALSEHAAQQARKLQRVRLGLDADCTAAECSKAHEEMKNPEENRSRGSPALVLFSPGSVCPCEFLPSLGVSAEAAGRNLILHPPWWKPLIRLDCCCGCRLLVRCCRLVAAAAAAVAAAAA